jgi:hypothetical protein
MRIWERKGNKKIEDIEGVTLKGKRERQVRLIKNKGRGKK